MPGKSSFKKFVRKLDGNTESERGRRWSKKVAEPIQSSSDELSSTLGFSTYQWIIIDEADQLVPSDFDGVEQEDDTGELIPEYLFQLSSGNSSF